jgi:hypothetical protein
MPLPTPVTRTSTYTHRDWKTEMAVVATCFAGMLTDLDEMTASLGEVEAGRTHRALVNGCRVNVLELLKGVVRHVGNTDDRYLPVYEAIRRAGGHTEVANDKRYHQHD